MGKPTIYQTLRQVLGRAFRETGQALDRVGIKGHQMAVTTRVIGDDPLIYQDHLSRHRQQMPLLRRGKPVVSKDVAFLAPCATLIGSVYIGDGSSVFYKSILRADNCDHAEAFSKDYANIGFTNNETPLGESCENPQALTSHESFSSEILNVEKDVTSVGALEEEDLHPSIPKHPHEWELKPNRKDKSNSTATGGGIFIGSHTNVQDGCIIDAKHDHTRIGNGVTIGHLASIHSATIGDHCLIGMGSLLQEGVVIEEESFVAAGANVTKNTRIGTGELWVGSPARKLRDLTAAERDRLHYQANEYVGVASALKDNMLLGGNLPDSLLEYMEYGHDDYYEEDDDGYDRAYESDKVDGAPVEEAVTSTKLREP